MTNTLAIRRILATRRTMLRAAELLEREGAALKASHVVCGTWGTDPCDRDARSDYAEMTKVAADLRMFAADK